MKKEIIINSSLSETRIAITEDGRLAELLSEIPDQERLIGNIYMGRVQKIVQGMNAAFIDIGLQQDAFLHFSDVDSSMEDSFFIEDDDDEEEQELSDSAAVALRRKSAKPGTKLSPANRPTFATKRSGEVKINIEPKQQIIVQVVREAYHSKGVRVTTKIALPGRYTVLMPFETLIGVSRKIASPLERKRLRSLAKSKLPVGSGAIIRTAAAGADDADLRRDYEFLGDLWKNIEEKVRTAHGPRLLHSDVSLANTVIRDLFTPSVLRVVVDSRSLHNQIIAYLKWASPHLANRVALYEGQDPIFRAMGVERDIQSTYERKVALGTGASVVFDHTEALTAIDVNSGRATSDKVQEQNALKTNLDALKEIARQLRLRDIGGMIIVDFIDMNEERNRKRVLDEMKKETMKDRAKTVLYPLTQLGLMQITRQRVRRNIMETISEPCTTCAGTGHVHSKSVVLNGIEQWLRNFRAQTSEFRILISVNPEIGRFLFEGNPSRVTRLMLRYFMRIKIQTNDSFALGEFRVYSYRQQKDVTQEMTAP